MIDKFRLLQALSGLAHAMGKISDLIPKGQIAKDDPEYQLCQDLSWLCIHCSSMALKVGEAFLAEKPTCL